MKLLIYILLSLSSMALAKDKYLIVLGGAGEPQGDTTIFDESLNGIGEFSQAHSEYKVDISFNGGHSNTERIIREKFNGVKNQGFTNKSFELIISKYESMIESGGIKPGDNILLYIDDHGGRKKGNTHEIATEGDAISDFNNLGEHTQSLDRLKRLTSLAEEKGISLAIIDYSCFSGNTLALANSKTCVISGAGSDHVGVAGPGSIYFPNAMNEAMNSSSNLEEAFLIARKKKESISFPMISTLEGQSIQYLIYNPITPYLIKYNTSYTDHFIPFIEQEFLQMNQCQSENRFKKVSTELEKLISTSSSIGNHMSLYNLSYEVEQYQKLIEKIKKEMKEAHYDLLDEKKEICTTIPKIGDENTKVTECATFSIDNILSLDFSLLKSFLKEPIVDLSLSEDIRTQNVASFVNYSKFEQWKNELLAKNKTLLSREQFWKRFKDLQVETRRHALKVVNAEKEVYDIIYRRSMYDNQVSNACRGFKI